MRPSPNFRNRCAWLFILSIVLGAARLPGAFASAASCANLFSNREIPGFAPARDFSDLTVDREEYLRKRYGVDPADFVYTPKNKYPVLIRGSGAKTLTPKFDPARVVQDSNEYDVIIVGGGASGLTAALYLTDQGKRVLLVERESRIGGLAAGSELKGIRAAGGAAYSAGPDGRPQFKIFQHLGMGDYKKRLTIPGTDR